MVLSFARVVKDNLEATQRYSVFMTRDGDSFISLADRVRFARRHHADLLIAIHADALRGPTVRGATVYTLSERASMPRRRPSPRRRTASTFWPASPMPRTASRSPES